MRTFFEVRELKIYRLNCGVISSLDVASGSRDLQRSGKEESSAAAVADIGWLEPPWIFVHWILPTNREFQSPSSRLLEG
jgi:hypothetical protein